MMSPLLTCWRKAPEYEPYQVNYDQTYEDIEHEKMMKKYREERRGISKGDAIYDAVVKALNLVVSSPVLVPVFCYEYVKTKKEERKWCKELRRRGAVVHLER